MYFPYSFIEDLPKIKELLCEKTIKDIEYESDKDACRVTITCSDNTLVELSLFDNDRDYPDDTYILIDTENNG